MLQYNDFFKNDFIVFPLHKIVNGRCPCGCASPGKHPLHKNWQNTPRVEPIDSEYTTGYGILVTNGLLVVDVDARNGGVESYAKLVNDIPEIAGCGLIVATGSGNGSKHLFFKTSAKSLKSRLDAYPGIDFKSSGFIVGAGSLHASGNTYNILVGDPGDVGEAPANLVDLLQNSYKEQGGLDYDNSGYWDITEIEAALTHLSPDCDHKKWVEYGMALHHELGPKGFKLWDKWSSSASRTSEKGKSIYPGSSVLKKRWDSFSTEKNNLITINTLMYDAKLAGWEEDDIDLVFSNANEGDGLYSNEEKGFKLSKTIDTNRPPGFSGEVVDYINSQCIYPRHYLAASAALWALGNILSMRYEFQNYGLNLYVFGIAESATGKESIIKASREVMRAADMTKALYTDIKSSVEMTKNLIEHQASFYMIDEVTQLFKKLNNASKSGSSSYLEGITKELLEVYVKSVGFRDGRGDDKRLAKMQIKRDIKELKTRMDKEGEDHQIAIDRLKRDMDAVDDGIKNPFVSFLGFSTPNGFDGVASYDNVLSGLVGRCLISYEYDDNPKALRNYDDITPMSEELEDKLSFLRSNGFSNEQKIQQSGERKKVPISAAAKAKLAEYQKWAIEYFVDYEKQNQGFASLVRRSAGEMVGKVSAIIGACDDGIDVHHVEWAIAYVMKDLKEKKRIVNSSHNDLHISISNRVMGMVPPTGEYITYIVYRIIRNSGMNKIIKKETIRGIIKKLVDDGKLKYSDNKLRVFLIDKTQS